MNKTELLSKLDEAGLWNIVKNEGFSIPKTYGKRDLVKYLRGMLTLEKIKEYTAEAYEKETKRTIIHETIKEKGVKFSAKETTKIQFDKLAVIRELNRQKIDFHVLEMLANKLKEPNPKGKGFELYDSMSDSMLQILNSVFVSQESDSVGKFLEFRTANFIKQQSGFKIQRVETRHRFPKIGEMDVVGFDSENKPVVIAECKDKKPTKDEMAKWLENTRRVFQDNNSLVTSYFVTSNKLTPENLEYVETCKDVDAKKGQLKVISGILGRFGQFLSDDRRRGESGKVYLSIYEVWQNQFTRVFPRK
jgi:hypothetical protein